MQGSAPTSFARISLGRSKSSGGFCLICLFLLFGLLVAAPVQAAAPKEAALVIDAYSGKVLYARSADEYRYPASLTKVMTLYLLFEKLQAGEVTLKSRITMTPRGAGMPPSKLGLRAGQTLSVEDAILALVTRSANDVASATGAFIAGTEDDFAALMTKKARALGMTRTTYKNASGLPNSAQKTTARDQATLAKRIREDFPQYYHYFSTEYFAWGKARIRNHNRLLGEYKGTTGLKTGYTNASGFNLTATVERDNKFLIGVVMGGKQAKLRDAHMIEILDRAMPSAIAMKNGSTLMAANTGPAPKPVLRPLGLAPEEDRAALLQLASSIEDQSDTIPAQDNLSADLPAPVQTVLLAPAPQQPATPAQPVVLPVAAPEQQAAPAAPVDTVTAYAVAALRSAEGPVRQAGREIGNFLVAPANASVSPEAAANPLLRTAANDPTRREPASAQSWRDGDPLIPEGTWIIQIGAYAEQSDAVDSIRKAMRAAPAELGEAVPVTIPVKTANNRTLYRSRFGGFDGENAARNACGRLARQAIQCIPIPPSNWSLPQTADDAERRRG
ncbi:Serine-type D-Ala-D-Ala carboxypeptidase [Parvibaculum lavamentivorans DS-1]|uniref:Serine-type D-Ala-D-Ala carboxypeptidase n=1 Tax=Parvibaculum lavamentivorans (strain DS-1 / DSM 13023 / NCIMB 13966) TaxID=402881 RepID=A7HWX1_PARL1|nr:serine hydrolase [Parvibaculum lavamentivorans]ABS64404.1 Serine-type D-Ala-D-Ala carboxypeptidase [Parvibaculum lavamentivorans DS-1]